MQRTLTLNIEIHHPMAIVRLGGFMAQLEVYKLKPQVDWLIADHNKFLIFDLTSVTFIDSAGIGVLMNTRSELSRVGGQVVLAIAPNSQAAQAINTTVISKVLDIFDSGPAAIEHLRKKYDLKMPETQEPGADSDSMTDRVLRLEQRLAEAETRLAELEKQHPHK